MPKRSYRIEMDSLHRNILLPAVPKATACSLRVSESLELNPRSGRKIGDLTSGQVFDHRRKRDIKHAEIVLPTKGASWSFNRFAIMRPAALVTP